MASRTTFTHLPTKAGIVFGALFRVSVLFAAIPGHRPPAASVQDAQQSSSSQAQESQEMDHSKMSGMDMDDAKGNEAHAVHDMTRGHMDHAQPPHAHDLNAPARAGRCSAR